MRKMKILLIPGHGAGDPGALGNGFKEADLTREVVTNLSKYLSKVAEIIVFDFNQNMYKNLSAGKPFNFGDFDYVAEIHFNAFNKEARGTEVLVHKSYFDANEIGVEKAITKKLNEVGFVNRGVKPRTDLKVMNVAKSQNVDYALVEVCFIDNYNDMQLYLAKKEAVAKAIGDGIMEGFNLKAPVPVTTGNDITYELKQKYKITFDSVENEREFIQLLDEERKKSSKLYWVYYKLANK